MKEEVMKQLSGFFRIVQILVGAICNFYKYEVWLDVPKKDDQPWVPRDDSRHPLCFMHT
jgi:hypothetical protein